MCGLKLWSGINPQTDSITTDMTTKNNQMLSGIPVEPAAILLTPTRLTISTGSHRCILAGNLTRSNGAMNAADAAIEPSCSGTLNRISTITLLL